MSGILILFLLMVMIIVGIPVGFALGIAGAVGIALAGIQSPVEVAQQIYNGLATPALIAIPMFLFMANLMDSGGLTVSLVRLSQSLLGGIRGSLAVGTVVASMFMGGISGSSLADTTSVGAIMIPAMKSQEYPAGFASAVTSAANMVGPIIPPSILMILYGFATQQSIFALFFAGLIPGVLISAVYGVMAYFMSIRRGYGPVREKFQWSRFWSALVASIPAIGIPVLIIYGVLGGVFTVTESAAVAAGYSLVYLIIRVIFRKAPLRSIWDASKKTYRDTATVSLLLGGSALLALALSMDGLANDIVTTVSGWHLPAWALLIVMNLIMVLMGTFLEPAASILIIVSVLVPLVQSAGINLIQFGIIAIVNLQIGTLTPPVGTAAYITSRIAKTTYEDVIINLLPWLGVSYILLALVTYVPKLTLWLPHVLKLS